MSSAGPLLPRGVGMGTGQVTHMGYVGRARHTLGQLWQVPTFFLGLLIFWITLVTAPSRRDDTPLRFQADLNELRQLLDTQPDNPGLLVAHADNLVCRLGQYPRRAADIHFLSGSAYFRQL